MVKDPELLEEVDDVHGQKPKLGIGIEVEECFIHCAKAFIRSELWNPSTWPDKTSLPSAAKILAAHVNQPQTNEKSIERHLKEGYTSRLYE